MSESPWTQAFLSYARADSGHLEARLQLLKGRGVRVLRDTEDILPSEAWRARIVALIGQADAVVCVISPRFAASEVCAWEVQTALSLNKRLVPVLLEPVDSTQLPEVVSALNWQAWQRQVPDDEATSKLVDALSLDVAWVREHTRLATLAVHWAERARADALLLRGTALTAAELWLATRPGSAPTPTELHQQFISTSRAADLARRTRNLWIACSVAVLSVSLGTWAVWSSSIANRNLRVAESRRFASLSNQALAEGYPQRAALLAAHALELPEPGDGRVTDAFNAARKVLTTASGAVWLRLPGLGTAMSQVRTGRLAVATFGQEGNRWGASLTVAKASVDGRTGRVMCTVPLGDKAVTRLALSSDGRLATAVDEQRIVQIQIDEERCMRTLDIPHDFGMSWKAEFDPQGKWVVLADHIFKGAELFELRTGGSRRALGQLAGRISALALSADGSVLVAASDFDGRGWGQPGDALAAAWHLIPGHPPERQVLLTIAKSALPSPASGIAITRSASTVRVLIGRLDGTMTLIQSARHQVASGETRWTPQKVTVRHLGKPGDPALTAIAGSITNQEFWVGRADGQVSRVTVHGDAGDVVEGQRSRATSRSIQRLVLWPDRSGVAVAARDSEGWAPDFRWCAIPAATDRLSCRSLRGHEGGMVDLTAIATGELVLSMAQDRSIRVWQATDEAVSLAGEQLQGPKGGRLAESTGGDYWFVSGSDGSRPDGLLWAAGPALPPASSRTGRTHAVSSDGLWRVYSNSQQLHLEALDGSGSNLPVPLPTPGDDDLVAISPHGQRLAIWRQSDSVLTVWRQGADESRSVQMPKAAYSHLVWSPQENSLAIAEMQGQLWLWVDPLGGKAAPLPVAGGHGDHRGVAWHPSGRWLATAGFGATLLLWNTRCAVQTSGCLPRVVRAGSQLRAPVFSPDGRWLASAAVDGGIPVWRVTDAGVQEPPRLLQGHDGDVVAVSFSRDSKKLASASFSWTSGDNSIRVWDMNATDPAGTVDEVTRGTDWYTDVRMDARGENVVGLTQNGQVRRFPLGQRELMRKAREMAGRELSEFERQRFFGYRN